MNRVPAPEPACLADWEAAFRLIFQHLPAQERELRCANAWRLLQRGELSLQGLFLVRNPGEDPCGALFCLPVPGRSALLWPPGARGERHREVEDVLLRHACTWLRQHGVKLVQTLLAPEEKALAEPLLRNGFTFITRLWYMRHDLNLPAACLNVPSRLDYQTFTDDALFGQTLARTYEDTRDCPEVNGVRRIDEVLEGHRAQGVFAAERWWLAHHQGQPIGVLMMTEMPESGEWELAYMGVVPEARRRGFGREMLRHALGQARAAAAPAVTLSVDVRNQPAWGLYRALGFAPYDQQLVYLAIFA